MIAQASLAGPREVGRFNTCRRITVLIAYSCLCVGMWGNDSRDSNAYKIDRPCRASLFTDTYALFCTSPCRLEIDAPDSPTIEPAI